MEGLGDYVKTASASDELFVEVYPDIAADLGTDPALIGTEEHYRSVFDQLGVHAALQRVGPHVQWI